MPNEIVDLDAFEVSFVRSPANKRKFVLFKSEESPINNYEGVSTMKSIKELIDKEINGEEAILKAINDDKEEVKKAFQGVYRILNEYKNDIQKDDVKQLLKGLGIDIENEPVKKTDDKDQLTKDAIDGLNVSKDVKEQLKQLWKSNELMANQLKKEMEEKETKEFIAKAEQFQNIPNVSKEELADILKSFSKADREKFEKLESVLKSANEALNDASIFYEVGGSGSGFAGGNSYSKIEKMAEPIMKSENITREQAISRVLEQNPMLYDEYLNETIK